METKGNMLMNKYDVGRMLGQGNFAKVYYGRNLQTGENVAMKVIDKEKVLKVGLIDQIKREISVMGLVKHPNIVQLYEVMATKTKIYFVMEYCKGGELFNKVSKGRLKEDVARKYFQQLICAVSSCHGRGIYHRDLKPENLLLDENGNLKVSDFGLSAVVDSQRQDGLLHTTCGTPAYVAPEVIKRKGYDGVKADIWSCGVVLFVLLSGHLPFHGSNIMDIYRKIAKAEYKCPNFFPPDARRLLSKILDPNPDSRISIARIMATSWFRKRFDLVGNIEKPIFDCGADSKHSEYNNARPPNLNAFDIISLSTGFDLSGLFVSNDQKDEVQFTSKESASSILSKLEDIAHDLRLELIKNDKGCLRLERSNGTVSINVGIFEITPTFHLVEMKMSGGDLIECRRLLRQDMKPALEGVVWAWQGEQEQQQ